MGYKYGQKVYSIPGTGKPHYNVGKYIAGKAGKEEEKMRRIKYLKEGYSFAPAIVKVVEKLDPDGLAICKVLYILNNNYLENKHKKIYSKYWYVETSNLRRPTRKELLSVPLLFYIKHYFKIFKIKCHNCGKTIRYLM